MLLNQGSTKRKPKTEANLQNDAVLGELLGNFKTAPKPSTTSGGGGSAALKAKIPSTLTNQSTSRSHSNPFAVRPASTGLKRKCAVEKSAVAASPSIKSEPQVGDDDCDDTALSQLIEDDDFTEPMFVDDPVKLEDEAETETTPTQNIEDDDDLPKPKKPKDEVATDNSSSLQNNRGFKVHASDESTATSKMDGQKGWSIKSNSGASGGENADTAQVEVKVEAGKLPLISNEAGDKVLRMYWLDAFEDQYKHPGTVWLFGKVYIESAKAYVSCCVKVKNIERQVFLLAREKRFNLKSQSETDEDCGIGDVHAEFSEKISSRFKINEFKCKPSEMKYAFEHADVPDESQYLQVLYSPNYPPLPSDLKGETFSRVFGANQSSLERFLLERKIKGPCWLDFKSLLASDPPSTWCKLEALADSPQKVSVVMGNNVPPSPPVTILALNMKTTINPKTHQNEVTLVSGLVHHKFFLDRPAPSPPFSEHFCALTRPSDEVWPFDFPKVLQQHNQKAAKIDKIDSERGLLGFLLAKIQKIDPDVIVGHDVTGFDIEVLNHRLNFNKIPNWSRLGRLRRSQPLKGRFNEKQATTGRLVCDLKISAKELIRCKSYDLGALVEKLLGKPQENRKEVDVDVMRKAYMSSRTLLEVTSLSLQDAEDILQVIDVASLYSIT